MRDPKLSFGYSKQYKVVRLSEIATPNARIGWQNLRRSEFMDSGDVYIITGTDFENGIVNFKGCKFVAPERYEMDDKIKVHEGDILITKDGTIGKVAIVKGLDRKATLNAGVFVLNDINQEVCHEYLYHYLRSPKLLKFINTSSTGGTILHLNQSVLLNFPVTLPSLGEQQKIAAFFTALDKKISIKNATLKSFTALKADTMSRIFSQRLSLGTNGPWKVSLLKDVLNVERGGSPRPIDKFLTSDPDGLNWIKIGDAPIDGNRITSVKEKILRSGLSKTRFVRKGDLILSNSMSFGRPYILDVDGCIHDGWLSIKNSKNVFDVDFLVYLLASQEVKRQYKSLAGAGVVTNLNKDLVNKVILSYPTLREQKNIANILNSIDEKIVIIKKQVATLEKLKKGFMQQMFV